MIISLQRLGKLYSGENVELKKVVFMRLFRCFALMAMVIVFAVNPVRAQESLPELPAPIQNLVDEGAQIRYLGQEHGFDAWITIKNGQEQYFYVKPDRSAFVMGLLFDKSGELVTLDQVANLRGENGDELLDQLASEVPDNMPGNSAAFQSPSERLFADIQNSNWVALGSRDAPVVYSFIDPQCPHCHAFIQDLRDNNMLEQGKVQLRMIPVGFKDETRAQAAFLMAAPNPGERWMRHMDGDETALPAKADINQQGVQRNLSVMQAWEFNVTPMIVYRAKDGSVKLVRGRPQDINALVADLNP